MSSTEQKNITQPFISHCFTYGILATITVGAFDDFELHTGELPFEGLGPTPNLGQRLRASPDPISEARLLFPILRSAQPTTRVSSLILGICHNSNVFSGNQAVVRFAEGIISDRWGLYFRETPAVRHAARHASRICSILAPAGYSNISRTIANCERISYSKQSKKFRVAADSIDYLCYGLKTRDHARKLRTWCSHSRKVLGLQSSYSSTKSALKAFDSLDTSLIGSAGPVPNYVQKQLSTPKNASYTISIHRFGSHTYITITDKRQARREEAYHKRYPDSKRGGSRYGNCTDVYCFSQRDFDDLKFLLQSFAAIKSYHQRRAFDVPLGYRRERYLRVANDMWTHYMTVMKSCGDEWGMRNKLGVYFDVLQWRYLAWRSGDVFYDHSAIMRQKVKGKNLSSLPSQETLLMTLKKIPMDMAVDLLGMYKASIYPEVDPFRVVVEQRELHYSRHMTDWDIDSPEDIRFKQTRQYMWYLAIRMLRKKLNLWPGTIREGVEEKEWHANYKGDGIPGDHWNEAHDVDLTGVLPVMDISDEQYMRQQDAACAPPNPVEFKDFDAMRKAPRRHKRKLLYAIQEPQLPSLSGALDKLNKVGRELPEGYVGGIEVDLGFSTDIVTGSRCERHKDAPRPFYAASSPWGCITSYIDGITRDFLSNVPQSMLGKSTRQKYSDLSSTAHSHVDNTREFYMSDDKAKYSPRMDPQSQQLPADFFAELFDIPAIKACGPIMYHNHLHYRVCGHLVSYNSNGTDREGMRGASNTWLEIVAQGLATRLARDRGLIKGKSIFLSFIDDGLRKFYVSDVGRSGSEVDAVAREVIDEVIFGLRVLGRELSWDKTFISRELFVILNEIMYNGAHMSSGLKSFCTAGDIELKPVMSANDYEQLYFGKMRGAHNVGTPLDLCHYTYVFETLLSHYKMGVNLQNNHLAGNAEYRLFCITPYALGGGGVRSLGQMCSNEASNATKEGIGALVRLSKNIRLLEYCVNRVLRQPIEPLKPVDYMRQPDQFHVMGPRLRSQRMAAELRKYLNNIAGNDVSKSFLERDKQGMVLLEKMGTALMLVPGISAGEIRSLYSITPVAFVDAFIQKLASSTTLSGILEPNVIGALRRAVRKDLIGSVNCYRDRCDFGHLYDSVKGDDILAGTLGVLMR